MPVAKETRVRVEVLSKMTATAAGRPATWTLYGAALTATASSRTSACSAGREVVVLEEVAGHDGHLRSRVEQGRQRRERSVGLLRRSGSAAGRAGRVRRTGLTMNPRPRARSATAAGDVGGEVDADSRPRPRTPPTSGWPRPSTPSASCSPTARGVLEQPVRFDGVQRWRGRRRRRRGLPPKVEPCWPAAEQRGRPRAEGDERADREAAAQPLGQGHGVGHDPRPCWWASQRPVRPMPGLDLVEDQQGAGVAWSARGPAAGSSVARHGRRPRPGSVRGRRRRRSSSASHGRAQRVHVAERHVDDAGQAAARTAAVGLLPGQREGAHGAAVEGALGRR